MPDNCPCAKEPNDCAECAAEAQILRQRILDAVTNGEVSEEEVMETIFKVVKAQDN